MEDSEGKSLSPEAEETPPRIKIRVSEDRLAVLLSCTGCTECLNTVADAVEDYFTKFQVAGPPDRAAIEHLIANAASTNETIENLAVVQGTPPTPSKDEDIEWGGDFFNTGFAVDETTGNVDYRQRIGQPNVEAGQFLARIIPGSEGVPGVDVFGKSIPVSKPKRLRVRVGANVRHDTIENAFYATTAGRVRWLANGLSVDQVLTISGSVGLETGHINHRGALNVAADVLSDSRVETAGDIQVGGIVEQARLTSKGSLFVRGGIMGGPEQLIRISGQVQAKFILDADIEAGENIVVEREIVHSRTRTRAGLLMPRGRLVGGETIALGGVDVGQIGSDALTRTLVTVGKDFQLEETLERLRRELTAIKIHLERIEKAVEPLHKRKRKLEPVQQEAMDKLLAKRREIHRRRDEINDEIEAVQSDSRSRSQPCIVVRGLVFAETVFCIGTEQKRISEAYQGPLKATLSQGEIVLIPLRDSKETESAKRRS